ncbi:TlpA family protein disulfide reductase [Cumulibacter soli]|uniref:TlpA family protein disulfide reductase n=1 Tax=Cumulibacter soli TaxID=2546344 RepID=UPI003C7A0411
MPMLQEFASVHTADVAVIGIAMERSSSTVESFIDEYGVTYPIGVDAKSTVGSLFPEVVGLPVSLFIDSSGRVVETHIGALTASDLDGFLAPAR